MADEKKGITVKIDADLHAEIREYLERHEGMTMAEFITLAVDDELHPKIQQKEGNSMGNMRTMAFHPILSGALSGPRWSPLPTWRPAGAP